MFDKHALSLWLKKIGISYKAKKLPHRSCDSLVFLICTQNPGHIDRLIR